MLEITINGTAHATKGAEFLSREDGHPLDGERVPVRDVAVIARWAQTVPGGNVCSKGSKFYVTHDEAMALLKASQVELAAVVEAPAPVEVEEEPEPEPEHKKKARKRAR